MKTKYYNLIKDTAIFAVGNIGSKIILFFLVPFYTYYLSVDDYGIADLVFSFAQLIIPLANLTIYNGVLRFGISQGYKNEDVLLSGLIVTVLGCFGLFLVIPILSLYDPISNWKWYLYMYVTIYSFNSVVSTYLKVQNNNRFFACASILQTFVLAIVNIVLVGYMKLGVIGFLVANIVAVLLSFLFCCYICDVVLVLKNAHFNRKVTIEMICYSAPIIFNDIAWWIIHSSNKAMIESFVGVTVLGLYAVSCKIPSLVGTLICIFQQAWGLSAFREYDGNNDVGFYGVVFNFYYKVVFFVVMITISMIKIFMSYYVSDSFFPAWQYIPLLLVATAFSSISAFFGTLYGALKINSHIMWTTITCGAVNIVCNVFLIHTYGVWGAVISTLISYIVISMLRVTDILRFIQVPIDFIGVLFNSLLILFYAVFVSLDWYSDWYGLAFFLIFILLNGKDIVDLLHFKKNQKQRI